MTPLPATAAPTTSTGGRVCMFLAPDHVFGLGHVGWAYREPNGVDWDFGSTRTSEASWRKTGSFGDVLTGFRNAADASDPYTSYRCRNTVAGDRDKAKAAADRVDAEPYHILTNNCLTRSLEIFEAYDASGGLASLGAGYYTAPRWYFDNDLDGFEPAVAL